MLSGLDSLLNARYCRWRAIMIITLMRLHRRTGSTSQPIRGRRRDPKHAERRRLTVLSQGTLDPRLFAGQEYTEEAIEAGTAAFSTRATISP